MKRNRRLDLLVKQIVNASFKDDKLLENKASVFARELAALPRGDAIYALSEYLKLLKLEEEKTTLVVFSPVRLSETQVDQIKKTYSKRFKVTQVKQLIDSSLLGGFMVKIGDMVFDYSIKGKIHQVKEAIIS